MPTSATRKQSTLNSTSMPSGLMAMLMLTATAALTMTLPACVGAFVTPPAVAWGSKKVVHETTHASIQTSRFASLSSPLDATQPIPSDEDSDDDDEEDDMSKFLVASDFPLHGRYYQLEQLEEDNSILTEVYLNEDGTIQVGKTDGPKFNEGWGVWREQDKEDGIPSLPNVAAVPSNGVISSMDSDDGDSAMKATTHFAMSITQEFEGGTEQSESGNVLHGRNKIGTFPFQVERIFVGERTVVGDKLAISGKIMSTDGVVDAAIGFFNLLDTTEERLGENQSDDKMQ